MKKNACPRTQLDARALVLQPARAERASSGLKTIIRQAQNEPKTNQNEPKTNQNECEV
jgi:hypothetical protein